ncbi:MAG: SurA N-terminal domain-containing protein [Candidatus Pelagibacter sp.]|nr:SurA N-terminal domain-containing protein [Candidatus Pelagibacter sp.]
MISPFKDFTKKKIGGLMLIIVIIIAFGFGGFGGGFNTGNQNNIVKINSIKISTQDYMDYLNQSGLSNQIIKNNIDQGIIEELLSTLVSTTLLDLEIKDLDLSISEAVMVERIKTNKNFLDENGVFQRTKYEKFLLTSNSTASAFEIRLKNNELQKQLFTYISGGTKSPDFLINKFYKDRNSKLEIDYINLNSFYKKNDKFTNKDINDFITENSDKLKQDYINFEYVNISPKNLTGLGEFSKAFFDKIDNIENQISKGEEFSKIIKELNLTTIDVESYISLDNKEDIKNKIYSSRNNTTDIIEDSGSYTFYNISKTNNKLPDISDERFKKQITNLLFEKEKYEFNKNILDQINQNKFNQNSFTELGGDKIEKIKLNSIKDNKKFEINSIKILYSLPINSFTLIVDDQNNVYVAKTLNYDVENIDDKSKKFTDIKIEEGAENKNSILKSYDFFLNDKYDVVVNEQTIDRVKNYFK